MIKKPPLLTLGFFAPSSHYFNKDYIYEVLDKKLDKLEAIAHIRYANDIIHEYCIDRGIGSLSLPVSKRFTLPYIAREIIKISDVVCAVDNGRNKSIEVISEICKSLEVKLNILKSDTHESLAVEFYNRAIARSEPFIVEQSVKGFKITDLDQKDLLTK